MTGKHTPGPWFFDTNLHIYGTGAPQPLDGWPGGTTTEHPHVCTAKTVDDARLIIAAPELLEALKGLLSGQTIEGLRGHTGMIDIHVTGEDVRAGLEAIAAVDQPASAPEDTEAVVVRRYADGWIEWKGGERPVDAEQLVGVKFECGDTNMCAEAGLWDWAHGDATGYDIIAYRVVQGGAS